MKLSAGQRVRGWRELRAFSQKSLAKRAGIDNTRLCRIENDKTPAREEEIARIARALRLSMVEFYGEVG